MEFIEYQLFDFKEKVGMFGVGLYYAHNQYIVKGEQLLRLGLGETTSQLRVIGVIEAHLLEDAINSGKVEVKGIRKVTASEKKAILKGNSLK
ncbi:MAG: hypothetical protein ACRCZ0_08245 [Cetobacterium sp.]